MLLVSLLVFSLGVGTTLVQMLGWATMLPTYFAQTGSVTQAVENTFKGNYPCPMCKLAAAKRQQEESQSPEVPVPKKELGKPIVLFLTRFDPFVIPRFGGPSFAHPSDDASPHVVASLVDVPPPQRCVS